MLQVGVQYRIGTVAHIFPNIQLKGSYQYTTRDERQHIQVLQVLRHFDTIAEEHGIDYTISGGTLLGAIRHDGFIPWHHIARCDIPREQASRLEQAYNQPSQYTISKSEEGYKIMAVRTSQILLEVFLTEFIPEQEVFHYTSPRIRSRYPTYRNGYSEVYPRRRYVFEDLTLWGPANGITLAQRTYGENCIQVATVPGLVKFFQSFFRG